jgi:hypothetical protein
VPQDLQELEPQGLQDRLDQPGLQGPLELASLARPGQQDLRDLPDPQVRASQERQVQQDRLGPPGRQALVLQDPLDPQALQVRQGPLELRVLQVLPGQPERLVSMDPPAQPARLVLPVLRGPRGLLDRQDRKE